MRCQPLSYLKYSTIVICIVGLVLDSHFERQSDNYSREVVLVCAVECTETWNLASFSVIENIYISCERSWVAGSFIFLSTSWLLWDLPPSCEPTTACYLTADYKQPSQLIMEKILDTRSQNKSFLFVEFYFWFSSSRLSNTSQWCLNWPPYQTSYQETLNGYRCSMLIHNYASVSLLIPLFPTHHCDCEWS